MNYWLVPLVCTTLCFGASMCRETPLLDNGTVPIALDTILFPNSSKGTFIEWRDPGHRDWDVRVALDVPAALAVRAR